MFLCGIIKYAERTYALYCASTKTFRDSILNKPDSSSRRDAKFPVGIIEANVRNVTDLKPLEVVKYAFLCFSYFKGLVVDLIFNIYAHMESRGFFHERSSNDAFRVVEVELNFLYDALFTKLPVVYCGVGFGCRVVSVGAIVTSLVFFHYVDKKQFKHEGFEVGITYILLIGGIVLEVIAFFMLVFSDWTVVKLEYCLANENPDEQSWKRMLMEFIVNANVIRGEIICWLLNIGGVGGSGSDSVSQPTDSRWSESISGYNFINYCILKRSREREKIYDLIGIRAFLDEMVYVKKHPLPFYVKDFIYKELKIKSEKVYDEDTAMQMCSARGDWVLKNAGYSNSNLLKFVKDFDYDESLLLWHIATEVLYRDTKDENIEPPEHHRKIAKLISDYMIYLLIMKPGMMSAVSRKVILSFRQTCDDVTKIFDISVSTEQRQLPKEQLQGIACQRFYDYFKTGGVIASPILLDSIKLAQELTRIQREERWKIMSRVWVEMLSYGATHIKSSAHAQQLSKGGEFITVVWLLMTRLGLADQFDRPSRGQLVWTQIEGGTFVRPPSPFK